MRRSAMPYDPSRHHRRSIRLKGYDYTKPGAYFVTICASQQRNIFGHCDTGKNTLNDVGQIAQACWLAIPDHFLAKTDAYVIMPDHFHGIVWITTDPHPIPDPVRTRHAASLPVSLPLANLADPHPIPDPVRTRHAASLPTIIGSFKSAATRAINLHLATPGTPLWHQRFYDVIIRDEAALERIRRYILANPSRWRR